MYGTMGIGESKIGDPLSKIKIKEVSQLPKTGRKSEKFKEDCKEGSTSKKREERSPS